MARTWKDSGYKSGRKNGGKRRRHGFGNGERVTTRDRQFDDRNYMDLMPTASLRVGEFNGQPRPDNR